MKDPCSIVILDGHTANPGDLSWSEIEAIGPLTVHPRTAAADVVARARDADIVLTNKTVISREAIAALPRLACIGVLATGYNIVDVEAAKERGIPVCNVPEYSTPNVAQAVFALLLELTNHTGHHAQTVRAGRWASSQDFCYWDGDLVELAGLTLGLVGYGRIGRAVAAVGRAFGSWATRVRITLGLPNDRCPAALKQFFKSDLNQGANLEDGDGWVLCPARLISTSEKNTRRRRQARPLGLRVSC